MFCWDRRAASLEENQTSGWKLTDFKSLSGTRRWECDGVELLWAVCCENLNQKSHPSLYEISLKALRFWSRTMTRHSKKRSDVSKNKMNLDLNVRNVSPRKNKSDKSTSFFTDTRKTMRSEQRTTSPAKRFKGCPRLGPWTDTERLDSLQSLWFPQQTAENSKQSGCQRPPCRRSLTQHVCPETWIHVMEVLQPPSFRQIFRTDGNGVWCTWRKEKEGEPLTVGTELKRWFIKVIQEPSTVPN